MAIDVDGNVLVVGAGPVGLVAALELHRLGIPVRIIDKSDGPTPFSKAVGINAQSLELLERSGLTERLLSAGIRIHRANLWFEGKRLVSLDLSLARHRFNFILALAQNETERLLEAALRERGIAVERRHELKALGQDPADGLVTAHIATDDGAAEMQTTFLLGADGARSTEREQLGIAFSGHRYDEHWSLADVTLDWPYGDTDVHLFLNGAGAVLFTVPIAEDRIRAISQTANVLDLLPSESEVTKLHWGSEFYVAIRQAVSYQEGRCFLAGDAAHIHSPAGGRGMNLGIWDACSFAERVRSATLDGYTRERHPLGRRILAFTDRLFRVAGLKGTAAQTIRNFMLRNVASSPSVQRRLAMRLIGAEE